MSRAAPRGRTLARAIIGVAVYLTGVGLMVYAIPTRADTYMPGGLLAGVGAGLQGPALLTLFRARKRRRAKLEALLAPLAPIPPARPEAFLTPPTLWTVERSGRSGVSDRQAG